MNKKMVKLAMIVSLGFMADSFCQTVLVKNLSGQELEIKYELDDTVSNVIEKTMSKFGYKSGESRDYNLITRRSFLLDPEETISKYSAELKTADYQLLLLPAKQK